MSTTIPFIFESEENYPILTMVDGGGYIYAGSGGDGTVLRSYDRSFWSKIFTVDDDNVTALWVQNGELFIGTSPNGKIYSMDLTSSETVLKKEIGGTIYGFCYFQNKMYVAGGIPSQIYVYNDLINNWEIFYTPYTSVVNRILVSNNKMYVFLDGPNFITYDGSSWSMGKTGLDNISSYRNVSINPYIPTTDSFIDRNSIVGIAGLNNETIYGIFPERYAYGIKSADVDSDSTLILGTSNYGEVYIWLQDNLYSIFQTESGNTVYSIVNVDSGVNLAAIDNKLYLIYLGDLPLPPTTTTTTTLSLLSPSSSGPTTTTTTTVAKFIQMTYPQGGEIFSYGDTVNIAWTSTKGLNDAVKIDLYAGSTLFSTINSKTTNSGTYDWIVSGDIAIGNNYQIRITWLSSSTVTAASFGTSGMFSIIGAATTTTTTTPTPVDAAKNQLQVATNAAIQFVQKSRGILLLELQDEYITCMLRDIDRGGILFATSKGRVLGCSKALVNAYLTGDRNVYAEVKDGFDNTSDIVWSSFFYALYNKIVEINENKEIVKWKYEAQPSAIKIERITGVFLSPIMRVKEDFGQWKQLIWQEQKEANTEIIICVRASDSLTTLSSLPWDYCFTSRDSDKGYGSTGFITRDLDEYQIKGSYLQFKITMMTDSNTASPSVINLGITYSTAFALYFFTNKFSLQKGTGLKKGLMIASIVEPQNTQVQFGITNKNSADWNDYSLLELNKFFDMNSLDDVKIGIKMISYDTINIPEVAEFSLMSGGDQINRISEL